MENREGFFDLQVNGYSGVDFNHDDLSEEQLHRACQQLRHDGVDGILATVITDDIAAMARRLARLVEFRGRDPLVKEIVWGIHIEGPFINEQTGYVGAHPVDKVRPAEPDLMSRLLDAADGLAQLVTLAPERDKDHRVIRLLADRGVCVSAGHCDTSLDELKAAIGEGLTMFTHLGNGCPLLMHRHDNIIQRVLSLADQLWICFIADGVHVPYPTLGNYLRCADIDRSIVVTDAISAAGLGPGTYTIGPQSVVVGEDLVAWAPDRSHFMGSAGTMPKMEQNLRDHVGLSAAEIARVTCRNPRRALSVETE